MFWGYDRPLLPPLLYRNNLGAKVHLYWLVCREETKYLVITLNRVVLSMDPPLYQYKYHVFIYHIGIGMRKQIGIVFKFERISVLVSIYNHQDTGINLYQLIMIC